MGNDRKSGQDHNAAIEDEGAAEQGSLIVVDIKKPSFGRERDHQVADVRVDTAEALLDTNDIEVF